MAEIATDPQERAEWLTFVVIGGGPTGVELVGQIAELAHTVLPKDDRSVNTSEARIILLEGAGAVLPPFAQKLQRYTRGGWSRWASRSGSRPSPWTWTTRASPSRAPRGPRPSGPGRGSGPPAYRPRPWRGCSRGRPGRDRPGRRVPVQPDCTLPGHPEVFAIGDMVSFNKLPGIAQPAIQEGG